ncbi:MAG: MFS transporter [Sphingobacteriaceae bacterium]|nr:MFS transporter [Sphingobacteriaceae bacterium]
MQNITTPPDKFTSYQKFAIVILALLQFTVVLDFMILAPLGDVLMKSLDITPKQFSWILSSYAFSAAASGILAAGFADKFDRKKFLLFFYVGFVVGTLFCGLANTYETLLAARIVTGLFGGVIGATGMAIITDIFALNQRGRVMGFVQMAFAGSQILGIPAALYLASKWNWHVSFFMIVILAVLIGLAFLIKMKPVDEHLKLQSKRNAFHHLWSTLSNKSYQVGFLAMVMLPVGGFMIMPFSSAFLVNNIHIAQADLPIIFLCTGISSIIIMPIIGKISDKFDKFWLFTIGSLWAVVMVIFYTNLAPVPIWQVVVTNMLLFMGIMSRVIPATTLATAIPEIKDRGAFMSINSSLQQMAGGLASIAAGFIVTQQSKTSPIENYDVLGYVVSGTILLCIFLIYRVSVMAKNKQAQHKPV